MVGTPGRNVMMVDLVLPCPLLSLGSLSEAQENCVESVLALYGF